MSWFDDVNSYKLVSVTTGDGTTYELKMKFKGGSIDPLTASYNYPGKIGTKPMRNSCASPVYDLMFYVYQDDWSVFKDSISSFDNEWLIKHPLYGDIKGHPTDIKWDNTKLGDVEFSFQFQQSMSDAIPLVKKDYKAHVITTNSSIQTQAITTVGDIDFIPSEIAEFSTFVDNLETIYENILTNEYTNKIYDIRQAINDVTFDAYRFMSLTNDLLNIASRLEIDVLPVSTLQTLISSVKERNKIIKSQNDYILQLPENTLNLILFKENVGACNLTALTQTIITPSESVVKLSGFDITDQAEQAGQDDYKYKKDVDSVIENTNLMYNDYIDSISAIDFEKEDFSNYIPDKTLNDNVANSILLAIQEVKELSTKSKQENIYVTESDTTPELLAYKLYGSATDENINSIINDNDLFGRETLANTWRDFIIRKNIPILYYV